MDKLIKLAKYTLEERKKLPFSVYSCTKEQNIFNVPILKPTLIYVLSGIKELGEVHKIICSSGDFIFLANSPTIDMRNIPRNHEYFALLIEFEYQDFSFCNEKSIKIESYIKGRISPILEKTLQQFIEWSIFAPEELWSHRRQEMLQIIDHLGYKGVCSLIKNMSISNKLHQIVRNNMSSKLDNHFLCEQLAMSESTLRRRLKLEGTSIQKIKNQVKLGHALHLIQSTIEPIGYIAEQCGYQSQSRFTEKFKELFGLTPMKLRKTRMHD